MVLSKPIFLYCYFLLKVIVSFAIILVSHLPLLDLSSVVLELLLTQCYLGIQLLLILLEGLLEVLPLGSRCIQ